MNRKAATVGVLAIATLNMAVFYISPILGLIAQAFSSEPISNVQLVLSIANLTGLISAFTIGKLAMSVPNKTIALGGVALIFVSGMVPYFFHSSLWVLITCSGIMGIGTGFLSNILPALMADYFPEDQRQGMMGLQVSLASVGVMVFGYVAGILGTFSWNSAYLVYAYAAVVFVVVAAIMPKVDKAPAGTGEAASQGSWHDVASPTVACLAVFGLVFMLAINAYTTNFALVVAEKELGGSDVSGLVSTVGQVGGLLAGLCMGMIAKKGRDYMLVITSACAALGMLLSAFGGSVIAQLVGSFVANASLSFFYASAPFMMTVIVKPLFIPLGMSVLTVANSVGGFVSPYVVNAVGSLFGGTSSVAMTVGGIVAAVAAVVLAVSGFQKKGYAKFLR